MSTRPIAILVSVVALVILAVPVAHAAVPAASPGITEAIGAPNLPDPVPPAAEADCKQVADEVESATKRAQLLQVVADMFGGRWVEAAEDAEEDLADWKNAQAKYCGGGFGTGLGDALRAGSCWVGGNRGQGGPDCNL